MNKKIFKPRRPAPQKPIKWLEPVKEVLIITIFIWLFLSAGLFVWYLTESESFDLNNVSFNIQKLRTLLQEGQVQQIAPQTPIDIPGIDNYEGAPNFSKNIDKYDNFLRKAADKYSLNCTLLKAHMLAESHGRPNISSPAGAIGLMQLMPATARSMGYPGNLRDPLTSVMAGAKYLKHLEKTACNEKPRNAVCDTVLDIAYQIAAYNGGSRCNKPAEFTSCTGQTVWQCIWYNGYSETRFYVNKVKANYHYLLKNNWGC
jgi:soluble lytic murein transglycosylase-like protein